MIRSANIQDTTAIVSLLDQLGYPTKLDELLDKVRQLLKHPDHVLCVYEQDSTVLAVMSIHFVPQLALTGEFAVISYLAVDASARSLGIGKALEEHCAWIAKARNCDRIQLHCNIRRTDAHRFYERQGYEESRKYFSKRLKK